MIAVRLVHVGFVFRWPLRVWLFNSVVICSFFDILVFVFDTVADYLLIVVLSLVCWFADCVGIGLLVYCLGLCWVSSTVGLVHWLVFAWLQLAIWVWCVCVMRYRVLTGWYWLRA